MGNNMGTANMSISQRRRTHDGSDTVMLKVTWEVAEVLGPSQASTVGPYNGQWEEGSD